MFVFFLFPFLFLLSLMFRITENDDKIINIEKFRRNPEKVWIPAPCQMQPKNANPKNNEKLKRWPNPERSFRLNSPKTIARIKDFCSEALALLQIWKIYKFLWNRCTGNDQGIYGEQVLLEILRRNAKASQNFKKRKHRAWGTPGACRLRNYIKK